MRDILIIGAGGIGSYFIEFLEDMVLKKQIPPNLYHIADFDGVETKNVRYQNFDASDVGKNKADVMKSKSKLKSMFVVIKEKITADDLDAYDGFIICADNGRIRKEIFQHFKENPDKFFIDLRSEGRQIAFFTSALKEEKLNETLNDLTLDDSGSCQLKYEFDQGIIQFGNRIIASIGIQLLMNYMRDETDLLPSKIMVI